MQTLQIQLPDFISVDAEKITLLLASKLYEQGRLSLGQAAQVSGLSKRTFMELLGKYGVSVFNYQLDDIIRDFIYA